MVLGGGFLQHSGARVGLLLLAGGGRGGGGLAVGEGGLELAAQADGQRVFRAAGLEVFHDGLAGHLREEALDELRLRGGLEQHGLLQTLLR